MAWKVSVPELQGRYCSNSELEDLLQLLHRVIGVLNCMTNCPLVLEDLIVVTTFEGLVAEEMNRLIIDAADILFGFEVL